MDKSDIGMLMFVIIILIISACLTGLKFGWFWGVQEILAYFIAVRLARIAGA